MTFLPIVFRELRVAARRPSTYRARAGAAAAVIALGAFCFLSMQDAPPLNMAMTLFGIMTGSAVLYALFSGVFATADCLSQEKREGTLGLLFLTDLKGYDVISGKLVATSINVCYGMLAVLPILAVPLLLGGLTPPEFGRMVLVALNTLFFSLAVGMGVSSMSQSARKAAWMTLFLLMLVTCGLPLAGLVQEIWPKVSIERLMLVPSPGFAFGMAFESEYKTGAREFWLSLGVVHFLGWFFLALACVVTPRSWQDRPAGARTLLWRQRWLDWSYGNSEERTAFRSRLLDRSAYFWLCARARLKPAVVWAVLGLGACFWAWGAAKWHRDWLTGTTYFITGIFLNLLLKVWFAMESGRQLAEDRKAGTLELILSTPISVADILQGQTLALQRQFLGPVLVTLPCFGLFLVGMVSEVGGQDDRVVWSAFWLGSMLLLVADLAALYWVGLWQALIAPSPNRAAFEALTRILILPAIAWGCVMLAGSLLSAVTHFDMGWQFPLGAWFGLGLIADIGFSLRARHKLLTEFRLAAEQPYGESRGFWKRLKGFFSGSRGG